MGLEIFSLRKHSSTIRMHHSLNMDPTTLKGIELGDNAQIVRKKS
jgi:hypothetical protein